MAREKVTRSAAAWLVILDTPATMPSTSKVTQISQFSQRGLRNPPVK